MFFIQKRAVFCLVFLMMLPVQALAFVSDGSDGMFTPGSSSTLDLPEDGVFNFTSIYIGSDIDIRFNSIAENMPIYLLASEDIIINGSIDVSNFFNGAGGNLVISTPGTVQINGSLLANGSSAGYGGTITIESQTTISLGEGAYVTVAGGAEAGSESLSGTGSVTLTNGSSASLTYEGSTFNGVLGGSISLESGELKMSPVPVPPAVLLLASGAAGLVGLRRKHLS